MNARNGSQAVIATTPARRGFSLTELTVVVGVIGLVSTVAVVGVVRHRQDAEDSRMQAELTSLYKAMEAYRAIYGRYPARYQELRQFISIPNFDQKYEINPNP